MLISLVVLAYHLGKLRGWLIKLKFANTSLSCEDRLKQMFSQSSLYVDFVSCLLLPSKEVEGVVN